MHLQGMDFARFHYIVKVVKRGTGMIHVLHPVRILLCQYFVSILKELKSKLSKYKEKYIFNPLGTYQAFLDFVYKGWITQ